MKYSNKPKINRIILPVVVSIFFFVLMVVISLNGDLVPLMGNTVTNNYICNDSLKLFGNRCELEINAYKLGDINKDTVIDNEDITLLQSYINNTSSMFNIDTNIADVTGDGKITLSDVNKIKFYLAGMNVANMNKLVCPDGYELNKKMCLLSYPAVLLNNSLNIGTALRYNDSIWYVIDNKDDYVTLLKKDYISVDDNYKYNYKDIDNILNSYIKNISNDLKVVDNYKIRLINISDLKKLGFVDKTNTNYYESSDDTPYYVGLNNIDYWVDDNYILTNYNNRNYVYKTDDNVYAYIRPVINVYKNKIDN